jgi:hypothetical protein
LDIAFEQRAKVVVGERIVSSPGLYRVGARARDGDNVNLGLIVSRAAYIAVDVYKSRLRV